MSVASDEHKAAMHVEKSRDQIPISRLFKMCIPVTDNALFIGSWGSAPSCDREDRAIRETFCRFRTEIKKAPGSSGVCKPGAPGGGIEAGPEETRMDWLHSGAFASLCSLNQRTMDADFEPPPTRTQSRAKTRGGQTMTCELPRTC
jgi:hypothetical protein